MKNVRNKIGLILIMMMASIVFSPMCVKAESYTYRINIVLGGTSEVGAQFNGDLSNCLTIVSDTAKVKMEGNDCLTIYDLQYNDQVSFDPKLAVGVNGEANKYYVKGMRVSGANDWVSKSAFTVTKDDAYVIAYGVGEVVPYTVKYVDAAGNPLLETATYYGTVGEEVYIPYRFIDGYTPNAYNLHTSSLKENQEFVFTYTKTGAGGISYNTSISTSYDAVEGPTTYTYQTVQRKPIQGIVNNRQENGGQAGGNDAIADNLNQGGEGDSVLNIEDSETPLGTEDIIDVDDEPVAKALDKEAMMDRYRGYALAILLAGIFVMVTVIIFAIKDDEDNVMKNR